MPPTSPAPPPPPTTPPTAGSGPPPADAPTTADDAPSPADGTPPPAGDAPQHASSASPPAVDAAPPAPGGPAHAAEAPPRSFFMLEQLPTTSPLRRLARLCLEGLFFSACALLLAGGIGVPQSGFFAVFLAAAGPTSRVDEFLTENRRLIEARVPSWRANLITSTSVLALFLGSFAAFMIAALWMGERTMNTEFGFVRVVAHLGTDTILTRRFSGAPALLLNNALVLLALFALSFVYRAYGALLALSWNACVWGLVLAFLVRRGLAGSAVHPALFVTVSTLAVLPHLILEAAAYVVATLAAIYMSKALMKYSLRDPVFWSVMRAVAVLSLVALGALALGAVVEATLPGRVLALLAPR